jgi:hypothetical protein
LPSVCSLAASLRSLRTSSARDGSDWLDCASASSTLRSSLVQLIAWA